MKAQCNLLGRHGGIAQYVFHAQDDLTVYGLFLRFVAYLACNHGQVIWSDAKPVGIISRCMMFHAMVEHKVVESHAYCFRRAFFLFHLDVAIVLLPFAVVNQGQKNALTLSPALCALLLTRMPTDVRGRTLSPVSARPSMSPSMRCPNAMCAVSYGSAAAGRSHGGCWPCR